MIVVYYSGVSENTHRFVQKLQSRSARIPLSSTDPPLKISEPYLLITPSYVTSKRIVPPQVVKFLNDPDNRKHIVAVVGTGNTNFNRDYARAAHVVAKKCGVPMLYTLELLGTKSDVEAVDKILTTLEDDLTKTRHDQSENNLH